MARHIRTRYVIVATTSSRIIVYLFIYINTFVVYCIDYLRGTIVSKDAAEALSEGIVK